MVVKNNDIIAVKNNDKSADTASGITADKETKPVRSSWPKRIRIIAFILAVLLVGEIVLSNAVSVKFTSQEYENTDLEEAAEYIQENDSYLNADTLVRMRRAVALLGQPETYDEYDLFASVAIADQDYAAAVRYLRSAAELYTGDDAGLAALYIKTGCLMALQGNWGGAVADLKKGTELDSTNTSGWLMLCESYLKCEDYEKALDALNTYSTMAPLSTEELDAMVQLQLNLEKYDEALEICDKAEADGGYEESVLSLYRAQALLMKSEYAEAKEAALKSRDAGGDRLKTASIIALCCEMQEDYTGALSIYREMISDGTADLSVYQQAAQDAYLTNDSETVINLSKEALEKFGETEDTLIFKKWLGLSCFETGDYEGAEANITALLETGEPLPELNYLRGVCRMSKELYGGAIADFTESMASDELTDESLYNRALCYLKLGDANSAAIDFQEIIDRDCDEAIVEMTCDLLGISLEGLDTLETMEDIEIITEPEA